MNKPLLYIPIEKLDKSKYIRQLREVVKWKNAGARNTIIAPTGCGKTIIACITIAKMRTLGSNLRVLVVVPGIDLKVQWESVLASFGLESVTEVIVINSLLLRGAMSTDLLICDEYHRYPSQEFSKLFTMVNYSWLLGLTATIERIDGLEAMLLERAPISGTITVKEALANGWISEMIHLNVPVFLTRKEMDAQVELNNTISRGLSIFGGDFQLMQQCQNVEKAKNYALNRYPHDDVDSRYKQIQVSAIDTSRRIRARKDFLINTKHKIDASVKLIQELGLKTILFSESTLFATDIATLVGPSAVDYHTNVAPRERAVEKLKVCKTEKAVLKFLEEHPNSKARPYVNEKGKTNWGIRYFENKILSSANAKKNNMLRFKDNEVSVICTARALDVGFDCDSVEFGLEASRTTSTAQARQRKGRVCRTYTYSDGSEKIGIYISLYVPNTQDEKWLRASQVGMSESVIWIDDVEEAISLIKSSLKAKRIEAKP